jgi:hypothetical protein
MTDTATDPATTEAAPEDKPKAAPTPKPKHDCACKFYEVYAVGEDGQAKPDEVFTTGCDQQTGSVFAQGHDAKLVSFLVDGKADGYHLRHVKDGVETKYDTPGEAVADIGNALQTKAEKAWENRVARDTSKQQRKEAREALTAKRKADKAAAAAAKQAEKEAQKANGPKTTGAEVVARSAEGDLAELAENQAIIKVGKFEFLATVDADGNATYTDGSGAVQTRERDGYQLLRSGAAA